MNIAVIGPSGAGKGTHAASLSSRFRLQHVATGDLFRQNVQGHTALGILARKYIDQGELVPDEVVDAMIEEWCDRLPPERGALLDGFPRTAYQAQFLEELLGRFGRTLDAVVYLKVPDEMIVQRLSGRFICRSCQQPYHQQSRPPAVYGVCDECGGELYHRPDDSTELVNARLRVFHRTTDPLLSHYAAANKLILISGEGTVPDVDARLVRALEGVRNRTYGFATPADVAQLAKPPAAKAAAAHRLRTTTDIVLLGGPGSGKGTQAARLSGQLKLPHIATGDLFRENLRQATDLGKVARGYMDRGELVPDDITEAMVEERLARTDVNDGFILDGFPRTLPQAQALTDMLARLHRRLVGVVYIKVSDDALVLRLSGRLICRQCQAPYHAFFKPPRREGVCDACGGDLYQRSDDKPETVRTRLVTFHAQTEPLIRYFEDAGLLHEIDGEDDVDEITVRALSTIRQFAPAGDMSEFASTR
ncbi:MAG TPA: adenylate kinase [Opitutaceae bacterium]|nr:adenylate kinase [Opitutaceae bacterium]